MTNEKQAKTKQVQGYQPRPGDVDKYGYRPREVGPVNLADLKPPSGGTAIEPPQQAATKESNQ